MQKRTGWKLLGSALLLGLTSLITLIGPAGQVAAENCCSCHDAWCRTSCYEQCGSNESCIHACIDQCEYWDDLCIQNCPYPIC